MLNLICIEGDLFHQIWLLTETNLGMHTLTNSVTLLQSDPDLHWEFIDQLGVY